MTIIRSAALHRAVMPAVVEINCHPDCEPDYQSDPGDLGQAQHHGQRNHDSQDWDQWHQRGSERSAKIRTAATEDPYPYTKDNECEHLAYAHQCTNDQRAGNLLRSCVLDQDDFTGLDTSTEDQLAVRRPIETDDGNPTEVGNLLRCAIVHTEAPNVVAALAMFDVGQLAAIWAPAETSR